MLNIYIRNRLLEVLKEAYPELYENYRKFIIETSTKESKKTSKYVFHDRKIVLNSLSRTPEDIFISALLELSRHIDIINRNETHDDKEYFIIVKKLLTSAINLNMIVVESLNKYSDIIFKKKMLSFTHKFEYWTFDIKVNPKYIYIYVFEGFMIKNILKTNGYHYDPQQAAWIKKVPKHLAMEENEFTDHYKSQAVFEIIGDNSFYIRPVYLIKLKTYSIKDKELLKALDYRYDVNKKYWTKIISAEDYNQEMKNIENIPRQSLVISKNV